MSSSVANSTSTGAQYSDKYLERWREADVSTFLEWLCPDAESLRIAATTLSESIVIAHERAPARWGITKSADRIRLNVGKMEAAMLASGNLWLMVDGEALKRVKDRKLVNAINSHVFGRYASVPGSGYLLMELDEPALLARRVTATRDAHQRHLELAAQTGINPATMKAHHPGLVDAIAALAGRELPQPAYVQVVRPTIPTPPIVANTSRTHPEGDRRDVVQSVVERNPAARRACIAHYGTTCAICDRKLEEIYGDIGQDVIHVHHLTPFTGSATRRQTDPIADLRPLCPNCHAIVHTATPPLTIGHVRKAMWETRRTR